VAEVDHDAIKEQIVAILKANTTLYDSAGAVNKIALIEVGRPDGKTGFDNALPSVYVTNANPLERITMQGTMTSSSEALPCLVHNIRYKIIVGVDAHSARVAEEQLDDFQKLILESLEADNKLKNGGSALADFSRPELVETFSTSLDGSPIQGRVITYLVSKQT
jgi:hypothetical protein